MDINDNYRISAFIPNSDNLCGINTIRRVVNFGVNTTTTCSLIISAEDFRCTCLRKLIFDRLNAYFAPSDYVSKNGNVASFANISTEWLKIVRKNVSSIVYADDSITNSQFSLNTCENIPTAINVWFMFAEVGKSRGQPTNEILATYIK